MKSFVQIFKALRRFSRKVFSPKGSIMSFLKHLKSFILKKTQDSPDGNLHFYEKKDFWSHSVHSEILHAKLFKLCTMKNYIFLWNTMNVILQVRNRKGDQNHIMLYKQLSTQCILRTFASSLWCKFNYKKKTATYPHFRGEAPRLFLWENYQCKILYRQTPYQVTLEASLHSGFLTFEPEQKNKKSHTLEDSLLRLLWQCKMSVKTASMGGPSLKADDSQVPDPFCLRWNK